MAESASAEIQEEANALIINVNENSESEWEANSASGNESQNVEVDREANLLDRALANNITQMLESLEPSLSPECCIYRVPSDLCKMNEEAYTPQIISIGPFHHGAERLETMERNKWRYFKMFVEKVELNVENLVSTIRDREADVRRCYSHTSGLSSDDYVKMILLDASFIIMFFMITKLEEWASYFNLGAFSQRLLSIALNDIICMLENQLPFFIIDELYNFAFVSHSNYHSFTQLTCEIFEDFGGEYFSLPNELPMSPDPNFKIMHFVDLLRTFSLPQSQRLQRRNPGEVVKHLYSASQLDEAGVKFKVGFNKCLFDLKFINGVLEIPCLILYETTESIFRNLVALEQCHYLFDHYVIDYIRILDFLIDTDKDVDLLVRKGILVHTLGNSNAVTTLVNKLGQQIYVSEMNSNYCCLCEKLNTFCKVPRHGWQANLRRDYFSTPWRTASTVAAIILLVLTFIQTICSLQQK